MCAHSAKWSGVGLDLVAPSTSRYAASNHGRRNDPFRSCNCAPNLRQRWCQGLAGDAAEQALLRDALKRVDVRLWRSRRQHAMPMLRHTASRRTV
jgi:hypothetical protein